MSTLSLVHVTTCMHLLVSYCSTDAEMPHKNFGYDIKYSKLVLRLKMCFSIRSTFVGNRIVLQLCWSGLYAGKRSCYVEPVVHFAAVTIHGIGFQSMLMALLFWPLHIKL